MIQKTSISFIIPYYEVDGALLNRCLESLIQLDTLGLDWEAHVIDDGTPNSIAGEVVRQKNCNRIIYHRQEHTGLGEARNKGITVAQKEYIHFLDADDYLYYDACMRLFGILESERPELLTFNYHKVYNETLIQEKKEKGNILWRGSGVNYMKEHNLHGSACCYFIRKTSLSDIRFSNIAYHEDEEFTPLLFLRLNDIIITDIEAYAYYQRSGSLIHEQKIDLLNRRYTCLLTVIQRLKIASDNMNATQAQVLRKRVDMLCMDMIYTLLLNSPDVAFLKNMINKMQDNGFYPLPAKRHTLIYSLFSLATSCHPLITMLYYLFGWKRR